ncbi:MAG: hypothetical protein K2I64_05970, partial [Muribaculaceae bacterium]|nr:hypothetical protein [Muribaculaceae bacterium]
MEKGVFVGYICDREFYPGHYHLFLPVMSVFRSFAIRFCRMAVLGAVLMAAWTAAWGQTGDGGVWDIPRTGGESITEPSPEATAMRRYQDYPVSYATGTADISIPLLELPGGATSVQLGLSY